MPSMTISEARRSLAALIDMTAHGPVVIHRRKRAVAVVLSMAEYEWLARLNATALQGFCDAVGQRAADAGMTEDCLTELLKNGNDSANATVGRT